MEFDIVPPNLAIKAMRSNGFKSTDYAVSELIDNSIQAGLQAGKNVANVDVICVEKRINQNGRMLPRIDEIIIADDCGGMSPEVLRKALMFGAGTNLTPDRQKGIGKFGMGLPNASISQCKLVQVYTWQNGKCFSTSLDVGKIEDNQLREVPEPKEVQLPKEFEELTELAKSDSGTIVVWRELDKTTWIRHQGFFRNSEFLVGRMYRKFIFDGRAKINLKAYTKHPDGQLDLAEQMYVRPNDPLMLMTGTSAPKPYDEKPAFIEQRERKLKIRLNNGVESEIKLRFSFASAEARKTVDGVRAGNLPHGKYAARNVGVSIVRADRELELNTSWVNPGDLRERWWGVELSFQPELDDIFGVTNNKQAATNLYRADSAEEAANLGIKQSELEEELVEADDPKLQTYKISAVIDAALRSMRAQIKRQNEGSETPSNSSSDSADQTATNATKRRAVAGEKSEADDARENASPEERIQAVATGYTDVGLSADEAKRIAISKITDDVRYNFVETGLGSPAIFEPTHEMGEYFVKLNRNHVAYEKFIELLKPANDEESAANNGLKLLLYAWTRMEDEAKGVEKDNIQDVRTRWGQFARDFMRDDS